MKRRLFAMDLDGTSIRDDDHKLGYLSKNAIELAQQSGHIIAFVTGRRDVDMLSMDQEDIKSVDYLILNNGGKIINLEDDTVIMNQLIDPESSKKLINYSLNHNFQIQICHGLIWKVNVMTDSTLEYGETIRVIPDLFQSLDETPWSEGIEGFMATRDWRPISKYIDQYIPGLAYELSEPECIDIMAEEVNKWNGIKALANSIKVSQSDIIAVGNFYNDISMIKNANIGIAVSNAPEDIKKEADYVTKRDNNNDAIAEVISIFCDIPLE